MAIEINSITMPADLNAKGESTIPSQVVIAHNGRAEAVVGGAHVVDFYYPILSQTDFDWWLTTINGGEVSKWHSQASIPGLDNTAQVYADVTVEIQTGENGPVRARGGLLHNVRVRVTLR